jgi:hypothetical protein
MRLRWTPPAFAWAVASGARAQPLQPQLCGQLHASPQPQLDPQQQPRFALLLDSALPQRQVSAWQALQVQALFVAFMARSVRGAIDPAPCRAVRAVRGCRRMRPLAITHAAATTPR